MKAVDLTPIHLKSVVFGILSLSVLSSKCLLLRTHFDRISTASFLLYLPTLLLSDVIVISLARILLPRTSQRWSRQGLLVVSLASLVLLGAAASQIGFYAETGGNIDWRDAAAYTTDLDGFKVLLSGLSSVLVVGNVLLVFGAVMGGLYYRLAGEVLQAVQDDLLDVWSIFPVRRSGYSQLRSSESGDVELDNGSSLLAETRKSYSALSRILRASAAVFLLVTFFLRPEKPYDRISVTLPVALLDMIQMTVDGCQYQQSLTDNPFPFPHLISLSSWKYPKGENLKGWAPSLDNRLTPLAKAYLSREVEWLPEGELPSGFDRWNHARTSDTLASLNVSLLAGCPMPVTTSTNVYYNPVNDPLKITNLDTDILPTLRDALGHGKVKINHVVMILMEGLREEAWPVQKGSHFYELIAKRVRKDKREEMDQHLSELSPHIERITGTSMGFNNDKSTSLRNWTDRAEDGYGGVNVLGAFTPGTTTLKAFASIHCGAAPLPSDGFMEAHQPGYQPCLPQIFDMFNCAGTETSSIQDDIRNRPWKTGLLHSTSDDYDGLDIFNGKIGYHEQLSRERLQADKTRFNKLDPMYQPVNYFSLPEPVILPYLDDFLDAALAKRERIFLTHLTSSTHHRWDLPKAFPLVDYIPGSSHWGSSDHINKYLNTVRYHDQWMGTLLQRLEDKGISNETLVVFVGDHGLSFMEDSGKEGTYENDHLSNLRVGLTFRHPHLPRVQYRANASTISVLPTILDLLTSSGSLNVRHTQIASDLVYDYEGQSLIRPYKAKDGERRAWTFTVVNPGGSRLTAVSADAPWKLAMPLTAESEYRLANAVMDPMEQDAVTAWTLDGLVTAVRAKLGDEAAEWAAEAVPTAEWWVREKRKLWGKLM